MHRLTWRVCVGLLTAIGCSAQTTPPQHTLTWKETVDRFRAANPTLRAGQYTIDESRAQQVTAYLRPNPYLSLGFDQISLQAAANQPYRPLSASYPWAQLYYLHERAHKRELRLASAQGETRVATANQADLERTLLFTLRDAFNRVLLAKAIRDLAKDNLQYYDRLIGINRDRFQVGDIAKVDFQRVELQRVQYEADLETAEVNLRTAKIDLQQLLNDRTPTDQLDVQAEFTFRESLDNLEALRNIAIESRPDVQSARYSTDKARTDFKLANANGSTDPTFGFGLAHQPAPYNLYAGVFVNIPLRIFDRNQGEKARTNIDITRNQRLQDAAETAALHDVDAAYATLQGTLSLLRPYKTTYLKEASDVRETVSFAYQKGAASLLDFLDAQRQYRATQLSYLNLVGAYFAAANQVNLSVGREVIP